jgi:hypothetical protein
MQINSQGQASEGRQERLGALAKQTAATRHASWIQLSRRAQGSMDIREKERLEDAGVRYPIKHEGARQFEL